MAPPPAAAAPRTRGRPSPSSRAGARARPPTCASVASCGVRACSRRRTLRLGDLLEERRFGLLEDAPGEADARGLGAAGEHDERRELGDARRAELARAGVEHRDREARARRHRPRQPQEQVLAPRRAAQELLGHLVGEQPLGREQPLVGAAPRQAVVAVDLAVPLVAPHAQRPDGERQPLQHRAEGEGEVAREDARGRSPRARARAADPSGVRLRSRCQPGLQTARARAAGPPASRRAAGDRAGPRAAASPGSARRGA